MWHPSRRQFLAAAATSALVSASSRKPTLGLVASDHARLPSPSSREDLLDYTRVRDMVWQAIEYSGVSAGRLEDKILPGAWVVIKPNIVSLRPRHSYCTGDITDMRVTEAVLEYVASKSRAARVTIAEGGSYRNLHDSEEDNVVFQDGRRVNAETFDWGPDEWPGFNGSLGGILIRMQERFPGKKYDYVDLSYDAVRDANGSLRRLTVPAGPKGAGAASTKTDYYVTNTIVDCDFLITVPVMKVHMQSGITCCLKNYVGTAPRIAYANPGIFSNLRLHREHSVDDRIDPFIADLAAFHPPDYAVVDGILGLQYSEHRIRRPDQQVRSNLVIAGEDPVAADALAAYIVGFNSWDIDFLHLAERYGMGTMDLSSVDVRGDQPDLLRRPWAKPRGWYGRANREWLITPDADQPLRSWRPYTSSTDTLQVPGLKPGGTAGVAVRVHSSGHRKAFLWAGFQGTLTARLNGVAVMEQTNRTRYRKAQFQQPVELQPGENLLEFRLEAFAQEAPLCVHMIGPNNNGDTVEGIRWANRQST